MQSHMGARFPKPRALHEPRGGFFAVLPSMGRQRMGGKTPVLTDERGVYQCKALPRKSLREAV